VQLCDLTLQAQDSSILTRPHDQLDLHYAYIQTNLDKARTICYLQLDDHDNRLAQSIVEDGGLECSSYDTAGWVTIAEYRDYSFERLHQTHR
jgi:hypothetical protein